MRTRVLALTTSLVLVASPVLADDFSEPSDSSTTSSSSGPNFEGLFKRCITLAMYGVAGHDITCKAIASALSGGALPIPTAPPTPPGSGSSGITTSLPSLPSLPAVPPLPSIPSPPSNGSITPPPDDSAPYPGEPEPSPSPEPEEPSPPID